MDGWMAAKHCFSNLLFRQTKVANQTKDIIRLLLITFTVEQVENDYHQRYYRYRISILEFQDKNLVKNKKQK